MAEKTFSPAEVAHAAGIGRATFHSWLARCPTPGPGQGQSREFTLAEAVRISVTAELTRLGIPVTTAGACCAGIRSNDYAAGVRTLLVLGARAGAMPTVDSVPASRIKDIGKRLDQMPCLAIIDISKIAANTKRILQDPMTRHRARMRVTAGWAGSSGETVTIGVIDPSAPAEPAPAQKRAPARKQRDLVEGP
jgi:hypothetical protein